MIDDLRRATRHSIRIICATLGVPRSSCYHPARPTGAQRSDVKTGRVIETIFRTHRRRYGYRRIGAELAGMEITCAPERVSRLMREHSLKTLQPRSFVPKTSDGRADAAFGYIESYYNTHRRHSALAYQTPAQFETRKLSPN